MATYQEIFNLASDKVLQDRVTTATVKAAQGILSTTPTPAADRVNWASSVVQSPVRVGKEVLRLVLAANDGLSVAAIQSASDSAIQSNVDDVVDSLVLAHATP